jgi:hypothetical protein
MARLPRGQDPRVMLSVRVPADVLAAARAEADRRGETVTAVVERALRRYARASVTKP